MILHTYQRYSVGCLLDVALGLFWSAALERHIVVRTGPSGSVGGLLLGATVIGV